MNQPGGQVRERPAADVVNATNGRYLSPAAERALRFAAQLTLEASVQALDIAWEEHVTAVLDPSATGAAARSRAAHQLGEWLCDFYRAYRLGYDPDWRERAPGETTPPMRERARRWISGSCARQRTA